MDSKAKLLQYKEQIENIDKAINTIKGTIISNQTIYDMKVKERQDIVDDLENKNIKIEDLDDLIKTTEESLVQEINLVTNKINDFNNNTSSDMQENNNRTVDILDGI